MRNLIFLACLLIAQCSYSQATYPKQTVLDGDTVVLINLNQMRLINYNFLSLEECLVLNKSYIQQIETYKSRIKQTDNLEANLRTQIGNLKRIDLVQQSTIDVLNKDKGKLEKKLRLTKTTRVISTCVGVVGGGYLGYIIGKIGVL